MSYINVETVEDVVTKIIDWEIESNVRFIGTFMTNNVDNSTWAYWLLAKGHVKHANNIIMELLSGEEFISSEVLYIVFDECDEDTHLAEENMIKNIELIAEFLVETPTYLEKLNKFLENN